MRKRSLITTEGVIYCSLACAELGAAHHHSVRSGHRGLNRSAFSSRSR